MAAQIIDGKLLSARVLDTLKERTDKLIEAGVIPGLTVILVGDNPASQIYVANKEKACAKIGVRSTVHRLPQTVTQSEVEALIQRLNKDPAVHGILLQLPVPGHIDVSALLSLIDPRKDADGFHYINTGKLFCGMPTVVACTPKGAFQMILSTGIKVAGKNAVVVGRSNIVGKPMAMILMNENATVSVCHSLTVSLKSYTVNADILVVAAGRPRLITADMVKPGAVVIDIGITRENDKVVGDVDFEAVSEVAGFITPVPGGVGRMTVAMLLENTVDAAELYGAQWNAGKQ